MKTLSLLALAFALPLLASASPERDSLLGDYRGIQPDGRACFLKLSNQGGKTNLEFTDTMSNRTLRDIGQDLEAQLSRRLPVLVFKHNRRSLGDVTVHLEILRGPSGLPVSMKGTVAGWLRVDIDCRNMRR